MHFRFLFSVANTFTCFYFNILAITVCGQAFDTNRTTHGYMQSPNYPNPYPHNVNCTWTITAPADEVITVTFSDLRLENSRECIYDFVQVGPPRRRFYRSISD